MLVYVSPALAPTVMTCALAYGVFFHYLALGLPGIGYSTQMNLLPVGWRELAPHNLDTDTIDLGRYGRRDDAHAGAGIHERLQLGRRHTSASDEHHGSSGEVEEDR